MEFKDPVLLDPEVYKIFLFKEYWKKVKTSVSSRSGSVLVKPIVSLYDNDPFPSWSNLNLILQLAKILLETIWSGNNK